jgi:simple sugar transport system ATP-binding protein
MKSAPIRALSDRIVVMFGGEVMGIVDNDEVTVEELGLMMAGEKRQLQPATSRSE